MTSGSNQEPCNDYSQGRVEEEAKAPQEPETEVQGSERDSEENSSSSGGTNGGGSIFTPDADGAAESSGGMVWQSAGKKYHSVPNCGRMNPNNATKIMQSQAESIGLGRCSKCF